MRRAKIKKIRHKLVTKPRDRPAKPKVFFYCLPEDVYFEQIITRAIAYNIDKFPESRHIIYPLYGNRIYSSLQSKFPRFLKGLWSHCLFIQHQAQVSSSVKARLKKALPIEDFQKLTFVAVSWLVWSLIQTYWIAKAIQYDSNSLEFINNFKIKSIRAGDLIFDTYMRHKGEAIVNQSHWFFKDIVWRAYAIEKLCSSYLTNANDNYFFGTYSVYISHGIPLRVATTIKTAHAITFGSLNRDYEIHTNLPDYLLPSHAGYSHQYTMAIAQNLSHDVIKKAKNALNQRVQGVYLGPMTYMKSANTSIHNPVSPTSCEHSLVLMLHDFFDSPHLFQNIIFPEFWTWAYQTINFCASKNIKLAIKPHPNELAESNKLVCDLQKTFADSSCIHWMPKTVKNLEIFDQNPAGIISVYGSVAIEAAFLGLPVLLAGDYLGTNLSIGKVAKDQDEYFDCLVNPFRITKGKVDDAIFYNAIFNKRDFDCTKTPSILDQLGFEFGEVYKNSDVLFTQKAQIIVDNVIDSLAKEIY